MNTWHVHIEGQVQGVGFRPFIFSLAQEYGLKGSVNNNFDGVHIIFNASDKLATIFIKNIKLKAPVFSKLTAIHKYKIKLRLFDNFQIIHSKDEGETKLLVTPDLAMCNDCKLELQNIKNRRHKYAFVTCTNCGPRYSIINKLPYDRVNTEMSHFGMCHTCLKEYWDSFDRRYYSQTNSCSECGIDVILYDNSQNIVTSQINDSINKVVAYWEKGNIIAIKGIGGYILTCDAQNKNTVLELRKRKRRPSKPFALMYPDISSLHQYSLNNEILEQLNSHVAPIVLADLHEIDNKLGLIAPGLSKHGIMVPYAPHFELLLNQFGKPIIATSANISNSPIIYKNKTALNKLSAIADFVLVNNRNIVVPQDDSVINYSLFTRQKIILRRSRGLAPTYINSELTLPTQNILAMGAMLKSTFSLLHKSNTYISQHLGDLTNFEALENYKSTINHCLRLFNTKPEIILTDTHPEYQSRKYGEQISKGLKIPSIGFQHHIAHFGAIIGEHNLVYSKVPIMGVIWDGIGLGNDNQIWGGEFFKYEHYNFDRCAFFNYSDFILGDKMSKEPRISALSLCYQIKEAKGLLKEKFKKVEWEIYNKMLEKDDNLKTSSVGRLFDAVASLLGILDEQTYEGEAAMLLEAVATEYCKKHGLHFKSSYFTENYHLGTISTKSLMDGITSDILKGEKQDFIAAKFHYSLIEIVKNVAENHKIKSIAFSGGVFQNGLLVDLLIYHLKSDFKLYFHTELSPNDENISFGQLVCYQINKQKELLNNKIKNNVFSNSRKNQIN